MLNAFWRVAPSLRFKVRRYSALAFPSLRDSSTCGLALAARLRFQSMCRPSIKFQAGRRYAVVHRARYRPQDMGQYEIATVQTTATTAYVNTCDCIAIDIYSSRTAHSRAHAGPFCLEL
jgi:hypothetical protein